MADFLGVDDLSDISINKNQSQRIIFVAANYRKEVTSTILWLLQFGLDCRCFTVTPYLKQEECYLTIEQTLPPPDAREYMISMAAKDAEEQSVSTTDEIRWDRRKRFWIATLELFKKNNFNLYANRSPSVDHWLHVGSGLSGVVYSLIFNKTKIAVELYMHRSDAIENTSIFNKLKENLAAIESVFGKPLDWQPLDSKKACRIEFSESVDGYDESKWPDYSQWLLENMKKLEEAFSPYISSFDTKQF
jgi:hypothetical protein